jgi:hypothetical protein
MASRLIDSYNNSTTARGARVNSTTGVPAARVSDHELLIRKVAMDYRLVNKYSELLFVCCVVYYLAILAKRCLDESSLARRCSRSKSTDDDDNNNGTGRAELTRAGPMKILVQAPELIIFTINCLLVLVCLPLRLAFDGREAEDILAAIIMFLMPLKLLFFCRGSKSLGSFIVMIYKILVNDVLCFVVFLAIFIAGFSQCKCAHANGCNGLQSSAISINLTKLTSRLNLITITNCQQHQPLC